MAQLFSESPQSSDAVKPTIICPQRTVPSPVGACGEVVNFTPTVSDNNPGATYSCNPASGSTFQKNATLCQVHCHRRRRQSL